MTSNAEIVRVTAVVGDVLTITRTQESTSARTVLVGDQVAATITKKTLTDIETATITVTASTGLAGGGAVALGGTVTLTNAGVTSIVAGTGVSRDQATGAVTVTNTGVTSVVAGTGISRDQATGAVTVTNTGVTSNVAGTGISVSGATGAVTITNTGVTSLAGTAHQIVASGSTGAVTLTTPQDIDTSSSPTFAKVTVGAGLSSAPTLVVGTPSSATGFYAGADQALDLTVANGQRVRWTNSAQYLANSYAIASLSDGQADIGLSGNRMRDGWFARSFTVSSANANTVPFTVSAYSVTGSNTSSLVSLAGTLNTSGVVDVIKLAITDTAHGSGSKLLNFYGGSAGTTSLFAVDTDGNVASAGAMAVALGTRPNADTTVPVASAIVQGGLLWPDAGTVTIIPAGAVASIPDEHGFTMGAASKEPSTFRSLGNDRIEISGTDPLILDQDVLLDLSAGTLLTLDPDDWPLTGKVSNQLANATFNANESAMIPGLLDVPPSGVVWMNDSNGVALLAVA